MSKSRKISTPPVIRVFLSSTFADMEHERSYFNEVIAPKLGRICSERGVSFFNVDLRWGITEEDQIGGQVLPICLGEIDKCRPYFIGIIGNRYGSVMERVPEKISENIPWLRGKEGVSITELEMLYAVLDHEKDDPAINSAFYMRSDRLSRELYPELVGENSESLAKLEKLKRTVREDGGVLCSDYDTVEEFGEKVMRDLILWLDENFPEYGDVVQIRREWYNGEILRGHIEIEDMNSFLDSYIGSSRHTLLIYGDGARGKTACLTAWEPKNASKILINCASDESYRQPLAVMHRIMQELCRFLPVTEADRVRDLLRNANIDRENTLIGEAERGKLRAEFLAHLNAVEPTENIAVVINDLQLMTDSSGDLLSWFPSTHKSISFICSTNDSDTVENADTVGWNIKEMPTFREEDARALINNSLKTYGKNLSAKQFDLILHSVAAKYPGQLRFVISFLLNHGRFNNLDRLTADIAAIPEIHGIYRYVYDFLSSGLSDREKCAAAILFGLLRASDVALSEGECFDLAQADGGITKIEWAGLCRIFEQFELIHGDYWYVRDEEAEKFVDELLPDEKMNEIHNRLALHLYDRVRETAQAQDPSDALRAFAYTRQILTSLRAAKSYGLLLKHLGDPVTVSRLACEEPTVLRSAWLDLFLNTDADIGEALVESVVRVAESSKSTAKKICGIIFDLNMYEAYQKACDAIGIDRKEAVPQAHWESELSDRGIEIYNILCDMKNKREHRRLKDAIDKLLAVSSSEFNDTDTCKIYFFKTDAEEHLGVYEEALESGNNYYKLALKIGSVNDIHQSLSMRTSALYRLGRETAALAIIRRTGKMAYSVGNIREYLSSLNMTAMCYYRMERFEESVSIFDRLEVYWKKLGDPIEVCSTVINKCNALYLGDKVGEALATAEEFYASIKSDRGRLASIVSICGNIGIYAYELGQYEKAEEHLLSAIEIGKMIGAESTLVNSYKTLGKLYFKTDSLKKGIELYSEQMEFHWNRREYEEVLEIYGKSFEWLSSSNHKNRAADLEAEWRSRFSEIEGGLEFFERGTEKHVTDEVTAENLLEKVNMALSAGDTLGASDAYVSLAAFIQDNDPKRSAEYLLQAAIGYMLLNDSEKRIGSLVSALGLLFNEGRISDITTYDSIITLADDESFQKIASLWREIGDMADSAGEPSDDGIRGRLVAAIGELLSVNEKWESLAVSCILDTSGFLVRTLSADEMISLVSSVSENYAKDIVDRFDRSMVADMNVDLNYLTKSYFGSHAEMLIEKYEKYVRVLSEYDALNAPSIAGNIALIFRRRKDKEKAFRYHALSADLFRRAGKMDDCFIEIMNSATAHKELSSNAEAVKILREGLREAIEQANRKFAAMIAGNLASLLVKDMQDDDRAEIESCFAIEERYFRESGSWRDLTISLVNQSIYYVNIGASAKLLKLKVTEARRLADEAKLSEFASILSKLEWHVAKAEGEADLSEESIRRYLTALFDGCGFTLRKLERNDTFYYAIATPEKEDSLCFEAFHVVVPFDKSYYLRLIAVMSPRAYRSECEDLDKYVEWWNQLDKYTLSWAKEEKQIRADFDIRASDWNQLAERFRYFTSIWNADKLNAISLMMGIADLDSCRQTKLKRME